MKNRRTVTLSLILVCLLVLCNVASAQAPVVRKIEPPNWWVNYTPELTLLLTGNNLNGVYVKTAPTGASILDSNASANGHYLFIHLRLSSNLSAGNIALKLASSGGSTEVDLPVSTSNT